MNVCPHDGFLVKCPNPNHQVEKNFLNITLKSWNWPDISGPLNKQYPPFGVSKVAKRGSEMEVVTAGVDEGAGGQMGLAKTSGADEGGSEIKAEAGVDDTGMGITGL